MSTYRQMDSMQGEVPKDGRTFRIMGYARVSKRENWSGSHTLETQETRIRSYLSARYKHGHYDLKMVIDDGISGALGFEPSLKQPKTRPSSEEIRTSLASGNYDAFIVYNLSRLCRDTGIILGFRERFLDPSNTQLYSVCEDIDYRTTQGMAIAVVQSTINAMERDSIVRRTQDAATRRVELGFLHGQPGYGWAWQPVDEVAPGARRGIIPVPEQQRIVQHAKDRYLSGYSLTRIVRELHEMGEPSPAGAPRWWVSVLRNVLQNPLHAGLIKLPRSEELVRGQHWEARFFDPEVRDQLLETTRRRQRFATNTAKADHYLLNGIVLCDNCGKRLRPYLNEGRGNQFFCNHGIGTGKLTCPGVRIKEAVLDDLVINELFRETSDAQCQTRLRVEVARTVSDQNQALKQEHEVLQQRLEELKAQFERWADSFTRDSMTEEQFIEFNGQLREQQNVARVRHREVKEALAVEHVRQEETTRVADLLLNFPVTWKYANQDVRRALLADVTEYLKISRTEHHLVVRLKFRLCAAHEFELPVAKRYRARKTARGVAGLTRRHLALLYWVDEGKTSPEIAKQMEIQMGTVRTLFGQIRALMDIHNIGEIARLARGRVRAEIASLPLHELRSPQVEAKQQRPDGVYLSDKLMQVFPLYASGATTRQIAEALDLSMPAVAGRRHAILDAFGVKSMYEAGQKAKDLGLLTEQAVPATSYPLQPGNFTIRSASSSKKHKGKVGKFKNSLIEQTLCFEF